MFRNYFKVALRNLKRHKGFSFLNILGLAVGMTCALLILFWVKHELSYDRFNTNSPRLYRILQHIQYSEVVTWAINQGPLGPALKAEIPEIEEQTRFAYAGWRIKYGGQVFTESGGYADPAFLKMFTFPLVAGDLDTALADVRSVVLTQTAANKIFGEEDPLGKTINIEDEYDFKVSAVIQDVPDNSHLRFNFLANMDFAKELGRTVDYWKNSHFNTFVMLRQNAKLENVDKKIYNFLDDKPTLEDWEKLSLQPIAKIRLTSGIGYDSGGTGNAKYITIFLAAALFILVIACINFMNLSTARSLLRSKEVGLRKVVGAERKQIIKQFLGESILQALVAMMLAVGLGILFLPAFNKLAMKGFKAGMFFQTDVVLGCLAIVIFSGIVAGGYPAFVMSAFRPVLVLRGASLSQKKGSIFRQFLVVFQFSISVILLIGSLVIFNQIKYMQNRDLGYDKENLVTLALNSQLNKSYDAFKHELLSHPDIMNVGRTSGLPTMGYSFSNSRWSWEGKDPDKDILFRANFVDHDYFKTLKTKIIRGREFSQEFSSDNESIIINETAWKDMGFEDPIGKRVTVGEDYAFQIIGVVQDYNYVSLRTEIEPLILLLTPEQSSRIMVRIQSQNTQQTLASMESIWGKYAGEFAFDFRFLDDRLDALYRSEQRIGNIVNVFTILAICISCLGLFGLASFMALRRTKEIGVRKVLGATVSGIVGLLTRDFSRWVIIATVIAWPLAYLGMTRWLQDFPYRANIPVWIFLAAGGTTMLVALLTVCFQAIKAATSNPVDALRYE